MPEFFRSKFIFDLQMAHQYCPKSKWLQSNASRNKHTLLIPCFENKKATWKMLDFSQK